MTVRDVMVMGTIGRRVARRVRSAGLPVRAATRSGPPPFDWQQLRAEVRAFAALAAAGDAEVTDTVERVTGRPPTAFRRFAEAAAARGARAWA